MFTLPLPSNPSCSMVSRRTLARQDSNHSPARDEIWKTGHPAGYEYSVAGYPSAPASIRAPVSRGQGRRSLSPFARLHSASPEPHPEHLCRQRSLPTLDPAVQSQVRVVVDAVQNSFKKYKFEQGTALDSLMSQCDKRFKTLEAYLHKNTQTCDENRARISDLETSLQHKVRDLEEAHLKISKLEEGLQHSYAHMQNSAADLEGVLSDLAKIQSRASDLELGLQNAANTIGDIQSRVSKFEEEYRNRVYPLAALRPKMMDMEADIQTIMRNDEAMRCRMTDFSHHIGKLDQVVEQVAESHRKHDIVTLTKLIQTTHSDVAQLAEDIAAERNARTNAVLSHCLAFNTGVADSSFPVSNISAPSSIHGDTPASAGFDRLEGLLDKLRERTSACVALQAPALNEASRHVIIKVANGVSSASTNRRAHDTCGNDALPQQVKPEDHGPSDAHCPAQQIPVVDCLQSS